MTQYYGNSYSRAGLPWHYIIAAVIALVGFVIYSNRTSVNPVTGEKQHVALSAAQEVQLGLQSAPRMAAEMGGEVSPDDPQALEVSRIGRRVVQNSSAAQSPYRFQFHLLRDPRTVNAFALPGGQVFITRGLLDRLSNEAELAGVLGHECGHVVGRHASEQMAKTQLMQELLAAVAVAASDSNHPNRGFSVAMIGNVVAQMKGLQFTRHDETEADRFGLQFMSQAGYTPLGMEGVMQVLEQVTPATGRQPEFMVTHPYPEHRLKDIETWIERNFPNGIPAGLTDGAPLRHGIPQ
ncbi:MAG TPA: M48 family metalloprotease [Tepidisphaeraceae bacterium]|jgi:predicted Zn-dependent protease|nr:M48 family metalloprotease [Tepidisphaeraceae bacterium]